jgi:hypothetical protein
MAPIAAGQAGYGIGEEALSGIVQAAPAPSLDAAAQATVAAAQAGGDAIETTADAAAQVAAAEVATQLASELPVAAGEVGYGIGEEALSGVLTATLPAAEGTTGGLAAGLAAVAAPLAVVAAVGAAIGLVVTDVLSRTTIAGSQSQQVALAQRELSHYGSALGALNALKSASDIYGASQGSPSYNAASDYLILRSLAHAGFIQPDGSISTGGDLNAESISINNGPNYQGTEIPSRWISYLRSRTTEPTWDELIAVRNSIDAEIIPPSWSQSDSR